MLQREVQVVVRHLDRDVHRFEVAIIDRARDQHLVGDHRHFGAELPLSLGRETRRQRRIEERIVAVGRERHVGRNDFLVVEQTLAARLDVTGSKRIEARRIEVRENILRLVIFREAAILEACAPEAIRFFLQLGLHAPVRFLHQAGVVLVVALENLFEEFGERLRDLVVADELDQVMLVELEQAVGGRVTRDIRIINAMHLDVAAHQQRDEFQVELHQRVGEAAAAGLGQRLDPFAHPLEVGAILVPAIEVEQRPDLLGQREAQQIARIGGANFLQSVEERLGRERLHQPLGLGRGENQVALLPRRKPIKELQLFLERKIEKLALSIRRHRLGKDTPAVSSRAIGVADGIWKITLIQYLKSGIRFRFPSQSSLPFRFATSHAVH